MQHARSPCPSPSPEVCPSSCPLHRWCHTAISSSDALLTFCPQSFPASGTFPMSQLLASDDQNTGTSASASVLPTSIQGWYPLRLTGLISLQSRGLSRVFSRTTVRRHQFSGAPPSLWSNSNSHMWPLGRPLICKISLKNKPSLLAEVIDSKAAGDGSGGDARWSWSTLRYQKVRKSPQNDRDFERTRDLIWRAPSGQSESVYTGASVSGELDYDPQEEITPHESTLVRIHN